MLRQELERKEVLLESPTVPHSSQGSAGSLTWDFPPTHQYILSLLLSSYYFC